MDILRAVTSRRLLLCLSACAALVAGPGSSTAHAATAPEALPPAHPADAQPLSDERLVTRWAFAAERARVFTRPSRRAHRVARLHHLTEDGFPEVYVLLARWVDPASATAWVRLRVPGRPNGRTGWVREAALSRPRTVHTFLDIDRRRLRATLFRDGRPIFRSRIGVGKRSTPTPRGRFWIREKFHVGGHTLYGPRAMGTSAYAPRLTDWPGGGVVGLHGTNRPGLIPGRPSHGCIRFRNRDILRLYELVPRGTPVRIH
jgi:L,D-transpeptidase catalytic domain